MSTPVAGSLAVTPLYTVQATDAVVSWDDAGATWRNVAPWLSVPPAGGPYLPLTGGTLTGPLILAANPANVLGAATKQYVDGLVAPLAPLASPTFTGDPKAPTPATADNDTSIATTAFVKAQGYGTGTGTVTSIIAGTGLTGGTITTTGTIALSVPVSVANGGTGATTTAGAPWLPLTGGTLSGSLTLSTGSVTVSNGQVVSQGASAGLCFNDRSGSPQWQWYSSGNIARLFNGTTDALLVASNGNLTQSGSYQYFSGATGTVNATGGPLTFADANNSVFKLGSGNGNFLFQSYGGTNVAFISSAGVVSCAGASIGGTASAQTIYPLTNNTYSCGLVGNAWANAVSYAFSNASDRRDKTDIADLPDCLDLVRAISPQRYRWARPARADRGRTHWGFVAQDVEAAMAKAGHDFGGHIVQRDRHSLAYHELTAVLWKAVQELSAQVEELHHGR